MRAERWPQIVHSAMRRTTAGFTNDSAQALEGLLNEHGHVHDLCVCVCVIGAGTSMMCSTI